MWIDDKVAFQRRHRALMTVLAGTDPAGDPDRFERIVVGRIQSISIHKLRRMANFTAETYRETAHRRTEPARRFRNVAGDRDIAYAVWRLDQLSQKAARRLKRAVHIPKRTRSTKACELQACGAVALGDGSGLIDAYEEERHAFGTGALQGRETMRHLFD